MITNMTEGKPSSTLLKFSLPMLLSVVFQQFYNMADSVIAGKFAGADALAAVGASYPITMIYMAVAAGGNIGASVIISQMFGSRRHTRMKTAISTAVISMLAAAILFTALGLPLGAPMLRLLNTPDEILSLSRLYLNIYTLGLIFLFLYNISNGVFTALGDSGTPLYFLIGSSVLNIFLDILFVAVFHWGVAGVAWATLIAQGISSLLSYITLRKRLKKIGGSVYKRFSLLMLKNISRIAVPSILQQSFVSVGNLFIQGRVNSFGPDVIAGFSAATKLNTFVITSFATLGNAMSTFTAQNVGAGKLDRIPKGLRSGLIMIMCLAFPFCALYTLFGSACMSIFTDSSEDYAAGIVEAGCGFLRIAAPFYFVVSVKLIVDGVLRGIGAMRSFMASTFTDLLLRVLIAIFLSIYLASPMGIWLSWPIGWTVSTVMSCVFLLLVRKRTNGDEKYN